MKFIEINTAHQQQLDSIKNYISDVKKTASSDSDSTEIYGELLKKVIAHENKTAAFYFTMYRSDSGYSIISVRQ